MNELPIKLEKCPLVETILELRFKSSLPDDAVFGVVYQALSKKFDTFTPKRQGILDLPEEARNFDPNMKYQPYYQLVNDNLSIGIGPRSIIFSNRAPYKGWDFFKDFVISALELVKSSSAVHEIERIGLRYINLIDKSLSETTNLNISLCGMLKESSDVSTLRLEKIIDANKMIIFQLNDNVLISINNSPAKKASMIDIDAINTECFKFQEIEMKILDETLGNLHKLEKKHFFALLDSNYLDSLEPIYE